MGRLFGTDGVRGIANKELTPELAFNLGKAGTFVLKKENARPVIVIGKDTRVSGDMLENALTAGILAVGGNVIKAGIISTPAIAYLTRYYGADAGIVISASHNTFEYNGIKFFNSEGFKLDDLLEEKIEDIIISSIDVNSHITGDQIGKCLKAEENASDLYVNHLLQTVDYRLDGKKIVLDCANGASYEVAERVYKVLGADVTVIGNKPDGININDNCGSTHPAGLQEAVRRAGADMGLAFDGDADRLIVVDDEGRVVDGDKTIAICAKMLKKEGRLAENKVTATVMSNIGFHKAMEAEEIEVDVTGVGDPALIVYDDEAVGVAIKSKAHVGAGPADCFLQSGRVSRSAVVINIDSVRLVSDHSHICPQYLVNSFGNLIRGSVGTVKDYFLSVQSIIDGLQQMVDIKIGCIFFSFQAFSNLISCNMTVYVNAAYDNILDFFFQQIIQLKAFGIEKFNSVILERIM